MCLECEERKLSERTDSLGVRLGSQTSCHPRRVLFRICKAACQALPGAQISAARP
jgi:hypothetical protein